MFRSASRRGVFGFLGPGVFKSPTIEIPLGLTPPSTGSASAFGQQARVPQA
jgi:ABC-type multidrug transport system ATPase subunit